MLQLSDIMTRDVITVAPDTPLGEVAQLLAVEGISGVPVATTGRVLGVVSTSDLMDFSASDHGERGEDGRGAVWAPYDTDVDATPAHTGFFTDGWPLPLAIDDDDDRGDMGGRSFGEFTAGDVMTRSLFALAPGTPVEEAARYMLERGIHRVLVIEDGQLAGIATSMDFVKIVAFPRHLAALAVPA